MDELRNVVGGIQPLDPASADETWRVWDGKTKPRRSLGRVEELGVQLAGIYGGIPSELTCTIVVAAGDHGVAAAEPVSAYPQEVTAQMVLNFAAGGAAINVLARLAESELVVVDAGVASGAPFEGVRSMSVAPGTANFAVGPAM